MSRWLQSGRRRDLLAILYEAGTLRGQRLKTRLERHYETRLDPQSFYATLDALVDRGLVERETEGIHDVYRLTSAGVDGVESHHAWLSARLDGREDAGDSDGSDEGDAPAGIGRSEG